MNKFIKLFSCMSVLTLAFTGVDAMNANNANANNVGGLNGQSLPKGGVAAVNKKAHIDDFLDFIKDKLFLDYAIRSILVKDGLLDDDDIRIDIDWKDIPGSFFKAAIDWIGSDLKDYPNIQMVVQNAEGLGDEVLKMGCIAFLNSHGIESIDHLLKKYPDQATNIHDVITEMETQYNKLLDDTQAQVDTLRKKKVAAQNNNQ